MIKLNEIKDKTPEDVTQIQNHFTDSAVTVYAGQTAFFMMLSFFPFLLFFFSLLNLTPMSEADFLAWSKDIMPAALQDAMQEFTDEVYGISGGTVTATIIAALWMSSKSFLSLQKGLNSMYRTQETRNYFLLRLHAVLYSLAFAVILIAMLALMVFGQKIAAAIFPNTKWASTLISWRVLIVIPILFFFFMLLYFILPNRKQKIRKQVPGALLAAAGWIGFSYAFSIYVNRFNNYASFYGAMTTVALVMVWLYGCMYVLFLGGMVNSILEKQDLISRFRRFKRDRKAQKQHMKQVKKAMEEPDED